MNKKFLPLPEAKILNFDEAVVVNLNLTPRSDRRNATNPLPLLVARLPCKKGKKKYTKEKNVWPLLFVL